MIGFLRGTGALSSGDLGGYQLREAPSTSATPTTPIATAAVIANRILGNGGSPQRPTTLPRNPSSFTYTPPDLSASADTYSKKSSDSVPSPTKKREGSPSSQKEIEGDFVELSYEEFLRIKYPPLPASPSRATPPEKSPKQSTPERKTRIISQPNNEGTGIPFHHSGNVKPGDANFAEYEEYYRVGSGSDEEEIRILEETPNDRTEEEDELFSSREEQGIHQDFHAIYRRQYETFDLGDHEDLLPRRSKSCFDAFLSAISDCLSWSR